jgi:hypothetical protein
LIEREDSIKIIKTTFRRRQNGYEKEIKGRDEYIIHVIVGISGEGKSRMFDSHESYFDNPESRTSPLVPLFVVYNNDHSITAADKEMDIQVTFSARLLHRFLCEDDNGCKFLFTIFMGDLHNGRFENGRRVPFACCVIRKALELTGKIKTTDTLRLFIGIDEYQAMRLGEEGKSNLPELTNALLDATIELTRLDIYIFPLFAEIEWEKVKRFGKSHYRSFRLKVRSRYRNIYSLKT